MKKLRNIKFLGLLILLVCYACEDVVNVDLDSADPKLVIDAEIVWYKETDGSNQTIKLSRMADYYDSETPKVSNASVHIKNSNGAIFTFTESNEVGTYVCNNFIPHLNETYTLEVVVEDQTYTASETLMPVPEVNRVKQEQIESFSGGENFEVSFFYDDPQDETNYYLSDFKANVIQYPDYVLTSDDFYNGNEIKTTFSDEDLSVGDTVEITHRGISEQFYNYMNLVLETTSSNPFATPPANIRGNIVDQSNPNDYALGYFRLCEADHSFYTIKNGN